MKISVIIPIYNQQKYLSRCLDSVLIQTHDDLEIICVDDNSTDSTSKIIKEYEAKDFRVHYFKNPGKGVSSARNYGIKKATGEYIGFVDSDDFIQPQMYEFLLRAIMENNCEMVVCGYERTKNQQIKFFDYTARSCNTSEFVDLYNFKNMLEKEMVLSSACSKLIRRDYLEKYGVFENYVIGEDTIFCARLWINSSKRILVDLPLYGYFLNCESTIYRQDDEIKLSLMRTRLKAYKLYHNYDKITASYFLFRNVVCMERYMCNRNLVQKESYKAMNREFLKSLIPFLMLRNVNLKERLYYIFKYITNGIKER